MGCFLTLTSNWLNKIIPVISPSHYTKGVRAYTFLSIIKIRDVEKALKSCYAQLFSSKSTEQTLDMDVGGWLVEKDFKLPTKSIRKDYILYNF